MRRLLLALGLTLSLVQSGLALSATDDFNRADSGSLGANWTDLDDTINIVGATADGSSSADHSVSVYVGSWSADHYCEITFLVGVSTTDYAGCGVRLQDAGEATWDGYVFLTSGAAADNFLYECTDGSCVQLATDDANLASGDVIRLTADGTALTVTADGVEIIATTDASITNGGPGIAFFGTTTRSDNFSGVDLEADPMGPPALTVCAANCDYTNTQLQTALDDADHGEEILLQEGFEYVGSFEFRDKTACVADDATCYKILRTGVTATGALVPDANFPAEDIRITPAYAPVLATLKVTTNNAATLSTNTPSTATMAWWHVKWLQLKGNDFAGGSLMAIGSDSNADQPSQATVPRHFLLEQVLFQAHAVYGQHRGLAIHGIDVTVQDSWFDDFKSRGADGQAIWINSTPGPVTITNTYLEGGTETFLTGGSGGSGRPDVTVASAATTTSAVLSVVTDLSEGQGVTFDVGGTEQYTEITNIGGNECTGVVTATCVTFSPALTAAPTVPGDVDWSVVLEDLSFTKNYVTGNLDYRDPIVDTPVNVLAVGSGSGGTLAAGTHCYKITARHPTGQSTTSRSTASAEACAITVGATGSVTLTWNAVENAAEYYVYGRTTGAQAIRFTVTAPTVTYTDTGSAGTAEAVPTTSGDRWTRKNVFELKQCVDCLVEGNVFENAWVGGQTGYIMVYSGSTQNSSADSAVVRNITTRKNIIRGGTGAFNITGRDALGVVSGRNGGFVIEDNLAYDLHSSYGASARAVFLTSGGPSGSTDRMPYDVTINHNTFNHEAGSDTVYLDGFRAVNGVSVYHTIPNFIVTNTIFRRVTRGLFGAFGSGVSEGNTLWNAYKGAGSSWAKNAFAGATCASYPADTTCPTTTQLDTIHYTNPALDDYTILMTSSLFNAGTDGESYGADIAAIEALTTIAISGNNSTTEEDPDEIDPVITITGPTSDPTASVTVTPITLTGTCTDLSALEPVTWVNAAGGSGTAEGTSTWSAVVGLSGSQTGTDNAITVTCTDVAGNDSTDVITVTYAIITPIPARRPRGIRQIPR